MDASKLLALTPNCPRPLMLTAPGLFPSNLHLAYFYRILVWINDFQQSGSIRRQHQNYYSLQEIFTNIIL